MLLLFCRYKDCVECERVVVHGIKNKQNVSFLRTASPSTKFLELMDKAVSSDVNMTPWTAQGGEITATRRKTRHMMDVEEGDGQGVGEEEGEIETKELTKSETRRLKKEKRKREWEELYRIKPGEKFEDPVEVEAIVKAKREMGDYKLKTSSDFVVSEEQRTSTSKKRHELVLCRSTVSCIALSMMIIDQ